MLPPDRCWMPPTYHTTLITSRQDIYSVAPFNTTVKHRCQHILVTVKIHDMGILAFWFAPHIQQFAGIASKKNKEEE